MTEHYQGVFRLRSRACQPQFEGGSARAERQARQLTEFDAVLFLHERSEQLRQKQREEKTVADQLVLAGTIKPRRYRARYMEAQFQGPSARKDAEESERRRWTQELADHLRGTETPMGQFLLAQPGNQLIGGGRRASTLRSRVRSFRRFLSWLGLRHEQIYPTSLTQLTEYLQVRVSEPCNRGSLKGTHQSMVFLESMAGVPVAERFTNSQLYNVMYQELLVSTLPGRPQKQAQRVLVAMMEALEGLVVSRQTPQYFRSFAWWLLIQNWATLRFSDHRGIDPASVRVDETGFSALLTRSKTIGADKAIVSRPLVIDRCCYLSVSTWLQTGWKDLREMADYPRDYLMPSPSSNGHGFRKKELSYDTACAMQNRVLRMARLNDEQLFSQSATRFWTPHSNRTFLPTATAVLGFVKSARDFLGGWSAQASERYARIASQRIRNMQRTVVAEVQKGLEDPLSEAETLGSVRRVPVRARCARTGTESLQQTP